MKGQRKSRGRHQLTTNVRLFAGLHGAPGLCDADGRLNAAVPNCLEFSWSHPMSDTVITVENLSKSYLVGHESAGQGPDTFRDVVGREARNIARNAINVVRGRQVVPGDQVEE